MSDELEWPELVDVVFPVDEKGNPRAVAPDEEILIVRKRYEDGQG